MGVVIATIVFWMISAIMVLISLMYNLIKYLICRMIWSVSKYIVPHNVDKPALYFRNAYEFGVIFDVEKLNNIIQKERSK